MSNPLATVQSGVLNAPIEVGSPEWFLWLERADAFMVETQDISFTVQRVHRGDTALWLAFCAIDHEVRWVVLGSAMDLTRERLQDAAHQLVNWSTPMPEFPVGLDWDVGHVPRLPVASPDLLVTKLEMPTIDTSTLVRTRVVDRLAHALDYPLTILSAPSGYGKTTALAVWASETPAQVAWLALDENDNDPERFCIHLLAALDHAVPGILGPGQLYTQGAQVYLSNVPLRTRLINALAATEGEIALILDDYHTLLPDNEEIHEALLFFIEHLPAHVHVILSERTAAPLRISKLRVQRRLLELHIDDLRFTDEEARAFLEQSAGVEILPEVSTRIAARTEGWIAGLQLAALALHEDVTPADSLADLMSEHRYVVDFLADEVLRRLPREASENVLRIAALDRFNVALCDALPGVVDSQSTLETLERENAFLVPLDESHGWYRFHGLFAEVLRKRYRQTRHEQPSELYRQASIWHESNGTADEAVRYALLAGDEDSAVRIVCDQAKHLRESGSSAVELKNALERCLDALPATVIRRRPRLALTQAEFLLQSGYLAESEEWLDEAAALVSQDVSASGEGEAPDDRAHMKHEITRMRHDIAQSRHHSGSVSGITVTMPASAVSAHLPQALGSSSESQPQPADVRDARHSSMAPDSVPVLFEPISAREMEVLHLLAEGGSNRAIADNLVIAEATVKRHLGNIFRKLAAQSRTQAVARARALHLLHDRTFDGNDNPTFYSTVKPQHAYSHVGRHGNGSLGLRLG